MVKVTKHGIVLEKRHFDFELEGVLNPAVYFDGQTIHMFYRAVALGNRSTIGYCTFNDPLQVASRLDHPLIESEFEFESHGVEDPRIVKIDDLYYLSYCGYDGENAFGCVATSSDMQQFKKFGIAVPQLTGNELRYHLRSSGKLNIKYFQPSTGNQFVWNKNLVFFPRRINGKIVFLHRIRPGIQLVSVSEIEELTEKFWQDYMQHFARHIVLDPKFEHELSYIGNGCPPIETAEGWLLIYHGVHDTVDGYTYVACAALLDLNDPTIEISRLPYALFVPDQKWELEGYVDYVCFPTGTAVLGDTIYIYYGAADERIGCASVSQSELIQELLNNVGYN